MPRRGGEEETRRENEFRIHRERRRGTKRKKRKK